MKKLGFLVAVASLLCVTPALAQQEGAIQAAVDLHPVISLSDGAGDGVGFGFDVRGGYAMKLDGFTLVPEAVVGWNSFATGSSDASASLLRLMGGARAIFEAGQLQPAAFAHIGFGSHSVSFDLPPEAKAFGIESSVSRDTALIELGGALDYALDENFLIGGHTGLNFITASGGGTFLTLGAQASYRF